MYNKMYNMSWEGYLKECMESRKERPFTVINGKISSVTRPSASTNSNQPAQDISPWFAQPTRLFVYIPEGLHHAMASCKLTQSFSQGPSESYELLQRPRFVREATPYFAVVASLNRASVSCFHSDEMSKPGVVHQRRSRLQMLSHDATRTISMLHGNVGLGDLPHVWREIATHLVFVLALVET